MPRNLNARPSRLDKDEFIGAMALAVLLLFGFAVGLVTGVLIS